MPEWLSRFPLGERLHVVDGDNFILRPWEEAARLQDFLGIPREIHRGSFVKSKTKEFYCWKENSNNDSSSSSSSSSITCMPPEKGNVHLIEVEVEVRLRSHFRPHNEELFKMLGRRFDWG